MDVEQVNLGHVLVATKRPCRCWISHPKRPLQHADRKACGADRADNLYSPAHAEAGNVREGDQTVFHFHMHVVLREAQDGIALSCPRKVPTSEVLQAYAQQLRSALAAS